MVATREEKALYKNPTYLEYFEDRPEPPEHAYGLVEDLLSRIREQNKNPSHEDHWGVGKRTKITLKLKSGVSATTSWPDPPHTSSAPKTPNAFLRELRKLSVAEYVSVSTDCGIELSPALRQLATAINKSSWISSLEDDWDGEGSEGYLKETLHRAQRFLAQNAQRIWIEIGGVTPRPTITPGPEGSVDIQWKLPNRELLLNIPPQPEEYASFYGDNGSEASVIEGNQKLDEPATWMLMWLINQ